MTAKIIPIIEYRQAVARVFTSDHAEGFGMAVTAMMNLVNASKQDIFTKREIQFALLLLHPESRP